MLGLTAVYEGTGRESGGMHAEGEASAEMQAQTESLEAKGDASAEMQAQPGRESRGERRGICTTSIQLEATSESNCTVEGIRAETTEAEVVAAAGRGSIRGSNRCRGGNCMEQ